MGNPARRPAIDHAYSGPAWFEGEDRAVQGQNLHHVHCATPGCGSVVRNLKICRRQHIRMHERASSRIQARSAVRQVEIARRARLDVSSVNKILNGVAGPKFRDTTVLKVHAIADKLGYRHPKKGKKSQTDAAHALIEGARLLIAKVRTLPPPWYEELQVERLTLEDLIRSALEIWPQTRPAPADHVDQAVGA